MTARPGAPDSVLILSGSIGKGHDSVAEACRVALADGGLPGRVLDCMALLGGPEARIGMSLFRRMLDIPSVYDGFHFSHLRSGSWLPRSTEWGPPVGSCRPSSRSWDRGSRCSCRSSLPGSRSAPL